MKSIPFWYTTGICYATKNTFSLIKDDCVYFGNALFPGGNDKTVIGVIDTFPVDNHLHTYSVLKEHFGV